MNSRKTHWDPLAYRAVGLQVLRYGHVVIRGEFGHHALIFSIPQDTVQVGEVLEDVKAVLSEVSSGPSTLLRSLSGRILSNETLSQVGPRPQHNSLAFYFYLFLPFICQLSRNIRFLMIDHLPAAHLTELEALAARPGTFAPAARLPPGTPGGSR